MVLVCLAAYYFLYTLLFRPRAGYLNCGLFGGCFNKPIDQTVIWKLKVLGFFNQTRGEHSCGIYNGNKLVKGVEKNKKFFDFAVNVGIDPNDGTNNVAIGHTRYATSGAHTEENAHPFNIKNEIIMAHNGKIEDMWTPDGKLESWWQACRRYGIETINLNVDSQGLGHMLVSQGYKVLEEYKGYAALMIHRLKEPNVLYIYHGASKVWPASEKMTEERPLFYMVAEEGVYVSSLEDALKFIRNKETDEEPKVVPHNRIIRIKNGKIMKQVIVINRETANCPAPTPAQNFTHYSPKPQTPATTPTHTFSNTVGTYPNTSTTTQEGLNISFETFPDAAWGGKGSIFYHRNRYYMPDGKLCHGVVVTDKNGKVLSEGDSDYNSVKRCTSYFWKGVYLKDVNNYHTIKLAIDNNTNGLGRHLTNPSLNYAKYMSKFSKYPITNVNDEAKDVSVNRNVYYLNGDIVKKEATSPVFSNRNYYYKDGLLREVKHNPIVGSGGNPNEKFFLRASEKYTTSSDNAQTETVKRVMGKNGSCAVRNRLPDSVGSSAALSDITEIKKSFFKVFSSMEELEEEFTGFNYVALRLYVYDVLEVIMNKSTVDEDVVSDLIQDIYQQVVKQGITIDEFMERGVEPIDYYIIQALKDSYVAEEEEEDEESKKKIIESSFDPTGFHEDVIDQTKKKETSLACINNAQPDLFSASDSSTEGCKIVSLKKDKNFKLLNQQEDEDMSVAKDGDLIEQEITAIETTDDVIDHLEAIRAKIAGLNQECEDSKFAEVVSQRTLYYIDALKEALILAAKNHGHDDVADKIRSTMYSKSPKVSAYRC